MIQNTTCWWSQEDDELVDVGGVQRKPKKLGWVYTTTQKNNTKVKNVILATNFFSLLKTDVAINLLQPLAIASQRRLTTIINNPTFKSVSWASTASRHRPRTKKEVFEPPIMEPYCCQASGQYFGLFRDLRGGCRLDRDDLISSRRHLRSRLKRSKHAFHRSFGAPNIGILFTKRIVPNILHVFPSHLENSSSDGAGHGLCQGRGPI